MIVASHCDMTEADPQWIIDVQQTIGNLIEQPKMQSKHLSRPPFRFIHDTIMAVLKKTNYGSGLFGPDEIDVKIAGNDRHTKVHFLEKIGACIQQECGKPVSLKPLKAIAGSDPESTCTFLVELFHATTQSKDNGTEATAKIIASFPPPPRADGNEAPPPAPPPAPTRAEPIQEEEKPKESTAAEDERLRLEKEKRRREKAAAAVAAAETKAATTLQQQQDAEQPIRKEIPAPAVQQSTMARPATASRRPPRMAARADIITTAEEVGSAGITNGGNDFTNANAVNSGGANNGRRIFKDEGNDDISDENDDDNEVYGNGLNATGGSDMRASGRLPRRKFGNRGSFDSDDSDDNEVVAGGVADHLLQGANATRNQLKAERDSDMSFEIHGYSINGQNGQSQNQEIRLKKSSKREKLGTLAGGSEIRDLILSLQSVMESSHTISTTISQLETIRASVRADAENWQNEAEQHAANLRVTEKETERAKGALEGDLAVVLDKIQVTQLRIEEARERILRNEARIGRLLSAVVAQ